MKTKLNRTGYMMDISFISNKWTEEPCTGCGEEVAISSNGLSACPKCGYEPLLPCKDCLDLNDHHWEEDGLIHTAPNTEGCDWSNGRGCTPFPVNEVV